MKNYPFIGAISLALFLTNPSSILSQVGINTSTPDSNAVLDVFSTNRGFLPPRVGLSATTLPSPLTAHVAGMVVYNTAMVNDVIPGLYVNDGTKWGSVGGGEGGSFTETGGSILTKVKYRGRNLQSNNHNKPTLKIPYMNLEFRFADGYLYVRLLSAPTGQVTYYANLSWYGASTNGSLAEVTFTSANWNVWSYALSGPASWSNRWGFEYQISTKDGVIPGTNDLKMGKFYGFNNYGAGPNPDNETYVLAFEQY